MVHKPGIKVHIGGNALVNMAFFRNDLGRQPLHGVVEVEILLAALGLGQLLHESLEHHGAGVGQRIHRVTHAVDQPLAVKGLPVHDFAKVGPHLVLVAGVFDIRTDIVHHLHDLDVRAAVLGAFQAGQRRRHHGIGVRPGGGHHPRGEGGVVAAAVLHVQKQRNVQHVGLQRGVFAVGAQHLQQVLGGGKFRLRPVDIHAAVVHIVVVGVVTVHRQHGEHADEFDALLQLGLQIVLPDGVIVAGQRQHAAGQRVHQVLAGGLHDDVPGEVGGQVPAFFQRSAEGAQLLLGGQLSQQQQIRRLLVGEPLAPQPPDEVVHIVPPVPQLAGAGDLLAVPLLKGVDAGDVGQPRQNALAILVPQAALDIILPEQLRRNSVVAFTFFGKDAGFPFDGGVITHGAAPFLR